MNVLDLAEIHGVYKKVSTNKGGEYHGPCPMCGGNDRFHIWPAQKVTGDWWCRICGKGGDLIQWFMDVQGMSFPEACKQVGRELPAQQEGATPQTKRPVGDAWQPTIPAAPADLWLQHAGKFVEWSHQQLLALGEEAGSPLHYLAARGIRKESAIEHRLGWNPGEKGKDLYRAREAWGLDTVLKDEKKKKLWIPIGLVIPYQVDGCLRRVRIRIPNERRTPDFSTPYYVLPGSSMDTYVINPTAKAFVIIEAELDGILTAQETDGLGVGTMALGNSSAKPTDAAFALLTAALHISVALDNDLEAGSNHNPGGKACVWWADHFSQSERWPVPVGTDPGDAFKAGCDIREWVLSGLPPIFHLPPAPIVPEAQATRAKQVGTPSRVPQKMDPAKVEMMIRDAYSIITSQYPTGALEWIAEHRPDMSKTMKQAATSVDSFALGEDLSAFTESLETWSKSHLEAWEAFKSRPPVIEIQQTFFEAEGAGK